MRDQSDTAWDLYLSRLEEPVGRFTPTHVEAVRTVWHHCRALVPNLRHPQTAHTEEGILSMIWDAGDHHLEVEVAPNRQVEWFYLNRVTGANESKAIDWHDAWRDAMRAEFTRLFGKGGCP